MPMRHEMTDRLASPDPVVRRDAVGFEQVNQAVDDDDRLPLALLFHTPGDRPEGPGLSGRCGAMSTQGRRTSIIPCRNREGIRGSAAGRLCSRWYSTDPFHE